MKSTIKLPDDLLARARQVAQRDGLLSVESLIEEGLLPVLRAHAQKSAAALRINPVLGDGLTPAFENAGWDMIRDEIYSSRRNVRP